MGEPECDGIKERWLRTLKEKCLYLYDFATLAEARHVIGEFIDRYSREWLIERHGHRTPTDVRQALMSRPLVQESGTATRVMSRSGFRAIV